MLQFKVLSLYVHSSTARLVVEKMGHMIFEELAQVKS